MSRTATRRFSDPGPPEGPHGMMDAALPSRSSMCLQRELYRVPEAATVLGVSPRMIYTFIKQGVLPATYLPGTGSKRAPVRIARVDLLAFVERQRGARE